MKKPPSKYAVMKQLAYSAYGNLQDRRAEILYDLKQVEAEMRRVAPVIRHFQDQDRAA
jgi:hypothetical protein